MITELEVIEALRPVEDPELHRSIVDLEMVRQVTIDGTDVTVLIALTVSGCPLRAEITTRVVDALTPVDGVDRVKVDMTVMTPEELAALKEKMQITSSSSQHGHGPSNRVIPLADPRTNTRILGITSGKGGVGKSSITVNLAATLVSRGYEVAVLDADVYGFSIPKMLGIEDDPHVVSDMIVPPVKYGIRTMSMGFFIDDNKPVMWRGPMLHKALEQLLTDVVWGEPDFLLIDMPPGTGDVAISLAEYLPRAETYVVTTPQPAAQRVALRSGAMAKQINLPLVGVIENMSWFTGDDGKRYELFGEGGGQELANSLDVPLMAQIPLISALREGGDKGVPIAISHPDSEVAFAFEELAGRIEKVAPRRVYREELRIR